MGIFLHENERRMEVFYYFTLTEFSQAPQQYKYLNKLEKKYHTHYLFALI